MTKSLKRLVPSALALLSLCLAQSASALAQGIASAQAVGQHAAEVSFDNGQKLLVDFYAPNIFRLFCDPQGGEVRNPKADPPAEILVAQPRIEAGDVSVETADGRIVIRSSAVALSFDKHTGLFSVSRVADGARVVSLTEPVRFEKNKTTLLLSQSDDEYFYGGGVQNGRFSHRGEAIAIENTNNWVDGGVASPAPFYWSTAGYGLLWHTFKPGLYDFGKTEAGRVELHHSEGYLDVFFMVSERPEDLLADYYQLTGKPVLLPKFGFYEGHLNAYNRDYWTPAENGFMAYEDGKRYNESQRDNGGVKESLNGENGNYQFSARAAIDRYLDRDFPLGWFLPNDGYGAGYGQTGTLDGNIENLRQFGDYARKRGVEIGLWTQSDLHPKDDVEPLLQRDIVKEVRDGGVRVLKTDVAWVGPGYSFGLNGVADVADVMPRYGNNARPFIISVDGWAGTQRYAGIWTGDQTGGDWEYIRYHIPTFIGSGLSGQPNITNDVDGIFGGKNVPVNVREFQWKTFTPMELNMDGWGANPKYPQALGEPATTLNRTYLKLKSQLMPYTYSIAREATEGKPMIRALFLEYPNAWTYGNQTQYEYLFGPSFLVAPIYKNTASDADGNDIRHGIYLPKGKWVDYFSGQVYNGNCIVNSFAAPLWKLPVFVKADAIIPMCNPNNNPREIRRDLRIYEIYAEQGCEFDEYDDDGTTLAFEQDAAFRTTCITTSVNKDVLSVSIVPNHKGLPAERKQTQLLINAMACPKSVAAKIDRKSVKLRYVETKEEALKGVNTWCYEECVPVPFYTEEGSGFVRPEEAVKNAQIFVNLQAVDIDQSRVTVTVKGFKPLQSTLNAPWNNVLPKATGYCRAHTQRRNMILGPLTMKESKVGAYGATLEWEPLDNASFYEIEHEGMLYTTIAEPRFTFEDLQPESDYSFRVRGVTDYDISDWADVSLTTVADPLKWAVSGVTGVTSFANQGGSGVGKLFDRDEKSQWHSQWGQGTAIPGTLTLDLHSVNELEKLIYVPRADGGNGTIAAGSYSLSNDKQKWTEPKDFEWALDGKQKAISFAGYPKARYIRLNLTKAVGNFASGQEMYVFKKEGSESQLQGDINRDKRIDENDLTSYMNYTGLRRGDADFDYVSIGDINENGLIDAYDISVVTTQLDGGVRETSDKCAGTIVVSADKTAFAAGDEITLTVSGRGLHIVNGLGFCLPYNADELEFKTITPLGLKNMVNLTNDRLHTNGQKALYPTFVNRGNETLLDEGDAELFTIKFRAKRNGELKLQITDGMLIDRNLGTVAF